METQYVKYVGSKKVKI